MEMSIEKAYEILANGLVNAPSEHEWCMAFKMAIDIMSKYQKITEIMSELNGNFYGSYLKDRKALDKIYEVLEDGKIDRCSTAEAIPKADYEARLKVEKIAMLEDLKKEMNPIKECEQQIYGKECWNFVRKCQYVIQQKINALKGEQEQ